MRVGLRRVGKWVLMLFLALLVLALIYIGTLAFPSPLFAYGARFGTYRVYSDEPIPADFAQVIADAARRVKAMEHAAPKAGQRVYLCNSPTRYAFFAFLTRKSSRSVAIGLSVANETFVSMTRVQLFTAKNQGVFKHTRFEGNVAEVIAHEIAHFNSVHALGYRAHLAQPLWKSEGWAEYQANIAALRADPGYDLRKRIDLMLDDGHWDHPQSVARDLWKWQLLVEFLGEVKSYSLADLAGEDVTESSTREQMMAWYRIRLRPTE